MEDQVKTSIETAGIESIDDLITLDMKTFWQKRLLLYAIDPSKLGRAYDNYINRQQPKRRKAKVIHYGSLNYDVDRRMGCTLIRNANSTQAVIDGNGNKFDVRGCLRAIRGGDYMVGNIKKNKYNNEIKQRKLRFELQLYNKFRENERVIKGKWQLLI